MQQPQLPLEEPRTIVWFSCGAASAVAAKLTLLEGPAIIAYCYIKEEHPDNMRFLKDCEKWFGQEILILENEKYSGSCVEVYLQDKFLVGPYGARCTKVLKKEVRHNFSRSNDVHVFGFGADESHRIDRLIATEPSLQLLNILEDKDITHADCLALLQRQGIELPEMYKLGYEHNNCIGCVKGGMGYWNKIRVDFPWAFERMSQIEQRLGNTVLRDKNGPVPLKDLTPDRGNYQDEPKIQCGIACELVESQFAQDAAQQKKVAFGSISTTTKNKTKQNGQR